MTYSGNLDTAQIYLDAGLTDRAGEYLEGILNKIPEDEKTGDNSTYLHALVLMARLKLQEDDRQACASYIDTGLATKPDHVDLLFIKGLIFWDLHHYDEMFLTLVTYLDAVNKASRTNVSYEFSNEKTVSDVLHKLIPKAYQNAANKEVFMDTVEKMGKDDQNILIAELKKTMLHAEPAEQDIKPHSDAGKKHG